MQRFVAINNVCAWPNLTRLRDGSVVVAIFNQPSHAQWEGDVECWSSEDQGLTWSLRGTPTRHEPGCNRMNVAAGLAANGDLIVLASGWTDRAPVGTHDTWRSERGRVQQACVSRSKDGGRTWTITWTMPPAIEGLGHLVPFGDIALAADGTLCSGVYAFTLDHRVGHCYLLRSRDDGQTWSDLVPVVKDRHVEAAMLHRGDGRWLAAARVFGTLELDLFESDDDARHWRHAALLGIPATSAAHLLLLADGRILLTYGNRSPNNRGIDVRLSEDGGRTWGVPQRLIHLPDTDCGYPAALQFEDGRLLIAYYAGACEGHQRYHMGVLRLEAGEL